MRESSVCFMNISTKHSVLLRASGPDRAVMSVRSSSTISRKVLARDVFYKHSGLDYDVTDKIARHKMAAHSRDSNVDF